MVNAWWMQRTHWTNSNGDN